MRKYLCGSTALVAVAIAAQQTSAASGLKLGIAGYYRGAIGVTFGDTGNTAFPSSEGGGMYGRNNDSFRQEIRVNFTGATTLDNGINVDVLVGLEAAATATGSNVPARINRAYMDISGKFGQIRFGDADSAYVSLCVGDPGNVTANFGLNSPNETFSNAGHAKGAGGLNLYTYMPTSLSGAGTCFGLETRSTKIVYFSPTFGGFNFAVSFAPDQIRSAGGSGGNGGTFGVGLPNGAGGAFHDYLSVGVNFNHEFAGGTTLLAGISGDWALAGKTNNTDAASDLPDKPSMYQAGFQLGFGSWSVGASGQYVNNYLGAGYLNPTALFGTTLASPSDDAYMITVGGSHTMGDLAIGLQGLYDHFSTSNGGFGGGDHLTYSGVSLNGAYTLGPGISLEGQVAWTRSDTNYPGLPALSDLNQYEFDVGTAINF
jgi:outer membrane protein OmpU